MPNSNRSNKEKSLFFTDSALLEHTIRKEKRSTSIDNNIHSSADSSRQTSTNTPNLSNDSCELPPIDTSTRTLIDIHPQDMVATLILERDENGDLHDHEGHLRIAAGQRLDDQRDVIPDQDDDIAAAIQDVDDAAKPKMLANYNRLDQYYANISAIRPPAIQRTDFELKPHHFTLVAQTPYCGLSHKHPMDQRERFEDLVSEIKANRVPDDLSFLQALQVLTGWRSFALA